MKPLVSLAIALALMTTLAAQGGRSATSGPACDRACLEGFVNQYLEALWRAIHSDCRWRPRSGCSTQRRSHKDHEGHKA